MFEHERTNRPTYWRLQRGFNAEAGAENAVMPNAAVRTERPVRTELRSRLAFAVICCITTGMTLGMAMLAATAAVDEPKPDAAANSEPAAATGRPTVDELTRQPFDKAVLPLLQKYCISCHNSETARGGVQFDGEHDDVTLAKQRDEWERAVDNLQSAIMPPKDKPQPSADERYILETWIQQRILKADCSGPVDPGRVTIRRLNRLEYNNTIRDLIGVDFHPADDFPADDIGYGFDHIGDVLSLPPILLEKYLAAAEKISEAAIVSTDPARAQKQHFDADSGLSGSTGGRLDTGWNLSSNGDATVTVNVNQPGKYMVRTAVWQQSAGKDPAKSELRLDGKKLKAVSVKTTDSSTPLVLEHAQTFKPGSYKISTAFTNDFYDDKATNPKERDRNLIVNYIDFIGPIGVLPPNEHLPESHKRLIFKRPKGEADAKMVAELVLTPFVERAFRRPARKEEIARLANIVVTVVKEGDGFERGMQVAMQAILCSPNFLFRVEREPDPKKDLDGILTLDDFELATRLSYFMWSSMPDEELMRIAKSGTLSQPANLQVQVRRMIQDPKARALVDNFAGQWLQLRNIARFNIDATLFPEFDDELRTAMRTETELLFEAIIREDRSLMQLLDADFTFVNERLARHYNIPGVSGNEFRKVSVNLQQRGGILGHASMLTVTSNPTRTSPVKRGKWILDNLLAAPPPPAPPGVPDLDGGKDGKPLAGTLRQKMEQHRENPSCAVCHTKMDPLGFGLENFDAIGRWRTHDGSDLIDSSGTLPDGKSFQSIPELRAVIKSRSDDFRRCVAEKLATYALGRGLEHYDHCMINNLVNNMRANDDRFSALVMDIVQSDAFRKRRKVQ